MAAAQEAELENLEKKIRSMLVSAKGGRTFRELQHDFQDMFGKPVPWRELGFRTCEDLMKTLVDRQVMRPGCRLNQYGERLYVHVSDPKTQHIEQHVRQQKASKVSALVGTNPAPARRPPGAGMSSSRGRGRGGRPRGAMTRGRGFLPPQYRASPFDSGPGPSRGAAPPTRRTGGRFSGFRGATAPRFTQSAAQPSAMNHSFISVPFGGAQSSSSINRTSSWMMPPADTAPTTQLPHSHSAQAPNPFAWESSYGTGVVPSGVTPSFHSNMSGHGFSEPSQDGWNLSMNNDRDENGGGSIRRGSASVIQQVDSEMDGMGGIGTTSRPWEALARAPLLPSPPRQSVQKQTLEPKPVSQWKRDERWSVASGTSGSGQGLPQLPALEPPKQKIRLPLSIKQFAEQVKMVLVDRYPDAILVSQLGSAYCELYGEDYDSDPEKYYCKSWRQLVSGIFRDFCEVEGDGLKMKVRCKTEEARRIMERPKGSQELHQLSSDSQKPSVEAVGRSVAPLASAAPPLSGPVQVSGNERSEKEERLKKICRRFIGGSGIPVAQLMTRIKALTEGKELLDELNIWAPSDLISLLPDMDFHRTTSVISAKREAEPAESLAEKLKRAHGYALAQPGRRISGEELQGIFHITKAQITTLLSRNKGLFAMKFGNQGQLELEAILPPATLHGTASLTDSYAMVTLKESFSLYEESERYVSVALCDKVSADLSLFHVKMEENVAPLENLLGRMRRFYLDMDDLRIRMYTVPEEELKAALPCAHVSRAGGELRAFRVSLLEDAEPGSRTALVRFVDHGTNKRVDTVNLKYIPVEFVTEMGAQAIPCCLAGLEEWGAETKTCLVDFFHASASRHVWAYVEEFLPIEDKYRVHLCINTEGGDDRFLSEELISAGLATPIQVLEQETLEEAMERFAGYTPPEEELETSHPEDFSVEQADGPRRLDIDDPNLGSYWSRETQGATAIANSTYRTPPAYESEEDDNFAWGSEEEAEIERELQEAMKKSKEQEQDAAGLAGAVGGLRLGPPPGLGPPTSEIVPRSNTDNSTIMETIRCLETRKKQAQQNASDPNMGAQQVFQLLQDAIALDSEIKTLRAKLPPSDPGMMGH